MKSKYYFYNIITFLSALTMLISFNVYAEPVPDVATDTNSMDNLTLNSYAAILIDANTGIPLYGKNEDVKLYPASITKILTGYIGCEEGDLDDILTISQNALDAKGNGGSNIGLTLNEEISFEDVLYGVMLESANEGAGALAEYISGDIPSFVAKMNTVAKEIGCTNTNFTNTNGFHDDNHYTTCRDMALITKKAIENLDFSQIWGSVSHTISSTNKSSERFLHHSDLMLSHTSKYYYKGILGAKTGFHDEAGYTLATFAEKDGIELISIVMKADTREDTYTDTQTLLDHYFSTYHDISLFNKDNFNKKLDAVQIYNDREYIAGSTSIIAESSLDIKIPSSITENEIRLEYNIPESLTPPIEEGDIIGTIDAYYSQHLLGSTNIIANSSINSYTNKELKDLEFKYKIGVFLSFTKKLVALLAIIGVIVFIIDLIRKIFKPKKEKHKKKKRKKRAKPKNTEDNKPTENQEDNANNNIEDNTNNNIIEETAEASDDKAVNDNADDANNKSEDNTATDESEDNTTTDNPTKPHHKEHSDNHEADTNDTSLLVRKINESNNKDYTRRRRKPDNSNLGSKPVARKNNPKVKIRINK